MTTGHHTSIALDHVRGRRRAEEALGFLRAVSDELDRSTALTETIDGLARLVIRFNAAWIHIRIDRNGDEPLQATTAAPVVTPPDLESLGEFVAERSTSEAAGAHDGNGSPARQYDVTTPSTTGKALTLPVRAHGTLFGTVWVARLGASDSEFTGSDIAILEELARRLGVAAELERAVTADPR